MRKDLGRSTFVPKRKDAIVRQLTDEFLVYDKATNKAYCLNQEAAEIWRLCDGKKSVAEIVRSVENRSKSPIDEQMVWVALARLGKAGLLQNGVGLSSRAGNLSRRQALRKAGAAAAALAVPVIASVLVPKAEAAVSCSTLFQPCNPKPCCTGMSLTCVAHVCL